MTDISDPVTLPALDVGAYDPWTDTIRIEGTRYSGELFRAFGSAVVVGHVLRIESRTEDGVVTVTRMCECESSRCASEAPGHASG